MYNILLNGFSLVASLVIVRLATGSWLLALPFAAFWGLGLAFSIASWWQWERFLNAPI